MSLPAGIRLGPYEVADQIGHGGMGEVYRATDTALKRSVAIKILPESVAGDHDRLARFQREAEVLAALNHPNIAQIYAIHRQEPSIPGGLAVVALVMELVEGPTLADLIARRPAEKAPAAAIEIDEALAISRQIADALDAAHEHGIIHRDLKPANVKVREDGVVKVLDFGLAKARDPLAATGSPVESPTITSPAMTRIGVILGTAAYMSPEQARGRTVDKRADIWAFGCVLYEMLTGRRLFDGDNLTDTLAAVVRQEPDLTAVPRAVRRLLSKCLEKDPKRRLRDIGDAWDLLDDDVQPAGSDHAKDRRLTRVLPWAIAAAAAITAAAAVGGLWRQRSVPPEVLRFQIHAPAGSRLPLGTPTVSPDGRTLAYRVIDADGVARIHVRPINRVETRVLPGTEGVTHLFWSPDGRALAFTAELKLKRIDTAGGAPRDLATVFGPWQGTWGARDDILFLGDDGIQTIAAGGGAPKPVGPGSFPAFLPDGERYLLRDENGIQLGRIGLTARSVVLADAVSAPILAPTSDASTYILYLRGPDLIAQEFDESTGTVRGREVVVVPDIGVVANPALRAAVGVSRSGTLVYQAGGVEFTGQLTWFDRTGKPLQSLPADLYVNRPDLSRDGSSVVGERVAASREIHVVDLERKLRRRVPFESHSVVGVRWSPNGNRLAVGQWRQPILLLNPVNGGVDQLTELGSVAAWSPDERYVLSSFAGSGQRPRLVSVKGTEEPLQLGPLLGSLWSQGDFSPDGRYIAFTVTEEGREEVYVQPMPPATAYTRISVKGGTNPRWGKDSSELFFLAPDGAMMAAQIQLGTTVSASAPRELFRTSGARVSFDVTADGQRLLVSSSSQFVGDVPITVVVNWWAELTRQR